MVGKNDKQYSPNGVKNQWFIPWDRIRKESLLPTFQTLHYELLQPPTTPASGFSGSTLEAWTWPDMDVWPRSKEARFVGKKCWAETESQPVGAFSDISIYVYFYIITSLYSYTYIYIYISLYVIYNILADAFNLVEQYLVKLDHFPKVRRNIGPTSGM